MMNLIRNQGAVLSVLLSLLVSQISCQDPDRDVAYLKVRLALLKDHYKLMCKHYSGLAQNCSAPDFPAIRCTECPDGWLQVEDQCFHLSTDRQDQAASAEECKKMDARLAILTTPEQHDAVEKEGRRIGGFYTNYWIGLSDIENEGEWKWVDDSKLTVPFWNVEKAEPDNNVSGGPNGEDCAVVDSYSRTWYDVPCDFAYPRICQKAANPLP
ncbi:perlucin-like protein [Menidia menidia]